MRHKFVNSHDGNPDHKRVYSCTNEGCDFKVKLFIDVTDEKMEEYADKYFHPCPITKNQLQYERQKWLEHYDKT